MASAGKGFIYLDKKDFSSNSELVNTFEEALKMLKIINSYYASVILRAYNDKDLAVHYDNGKYSTCPVSNGLNTPDTEYDNFDDLVEDCIQLFNDNDCKGFMIAYN